MFTRETIKLGIAPIGWTNDDLPELGGNISFEQCISEMSTAGFEGCEVGNKFPRDTATLQLALSPYGLSVASAWYSAYFTDPKKQKTTYEGFLQHMNFLKSMGSKVIVICECGSCIQGENKPILGKEKPIFSNSEWRLLIDGLHHIGTIAKENGMAIVYHHHMGTGVQTQSEINHLMEKTDPTLVSLLFDTGHLVFAGGNPLQILKEYGNRIKHVHLKDLRQNVFIKVKEDGLSFLDSVKAGIFTVPGDGMIDYQPIFHELKSQNYQGWFIVEAEQDPDKANPLEYAKKARTFIREEIAL